MKCRKATGRDRNRRGMTLMEVLVALLLLTILVLGVASFIYYGRAGVYAQRDRLAVLEQVNARLELLRAETYTDVIPPAESYRTYWMRLRGGEWRFSTGRRQENVVVNGRRYPMETTVRYIDIDGGAASYDAVQFTVSMPYRQGAGDEIVLSTCRGQP